MRARRHIDGAGDARDIGGENLARQFRLGHLDLVADLDAARIGLGRVDEDAQRVGPRHGEQGGAGAARRDQIAEIDVALR